MAWVLIRPCKSKQTYDGGVWSLTSYEEELTRWTGSTLPSYVVYNLGRISVTTLRTLPSLRS